MRPPPDACAQIALLKKSIRQPLVVNQIHVGLSYPYPIADGMEFTLQIAKGLGGDGIYCGMVGSGTLDYCRLNDIQVQAWSPLRGVLNSPADAKPARKRTTQLLSDLANAKGTKPSALALAWPGLAAASPGRHRPHHRLSRTGAHH
jgi:predicted oxidoreductase